MGIEAPQGGDSAPALGLQAQLCPHPTAGLGSKLWGRFGPSSSLGGNFGITEVGKAPPRTINAHQPGATSRGSLDTPRDGDWSRTQSTEILGKRALGSWRMFGTARKGSKKIPNPLGSLNSAAQPGGKVEAAGGLCMVLAKKNPPEQGEFHPGRAFPALLCSRTPWNREVLCLCR